MLSESDLKQEENEDDETVFGKSRHDLAIPLQIICRKSSENVIRNIEKTERVEK